MNITVGMTSTTFSASTATRESWASIEPTMRMAIEMTHGIVTRWKKRRRWLKKKPKLSVSTSPNSNFTIGTI